MAMNKLSDAQALLHRDHNPYMYMGVGPFVCRSSLVAVLDSAALSPSVASSATFDGEMASSNAPSLAFAFGTKVHGTAAELANLTTLRQRLRDLGILRTARGTTDDEQNAVTPTNTTAAAPKSQPSDGTTKFLVCDHCRSHGLACNEASVCKECVLRRVPCIHRYCDISPTSKADCTRPVCFYVHTDYMPDMSGNHNPRDHLWLVLPGKLPKRASAGDVSHSEQKSEAEAVQAYAGVRARQQDAFNSIQRVVQSGNHTYETIAMSCKCVEKEAEHLRLLAAMSNMQFQAGPSRAS